MSWPPPPAHTFESEIPIHGNPLRFCQIGKCSSAAAQEIKGASRVISGDTLEVAGHRFRLANGRTYDCGHISATALMDLTVAATVTCRRQSDAGGNGNIRPILSAFPWGSSFGAPATLLHTPLRAAPVRVLFWRVRAGVGKGVGFEECSHAL